MRTLGNTLAVALIATMIFAIGLGFSQPADRGGGFTLGAKPASANWYFTCSTDRMRHRHYARGVTHIWKNIVVLHRGGNRYVRGTWATYDWGRERITASDRRTYGPC